MLVTVGVGVSQLFFVLCRVTASESFQALTLMQAQAHVCVVRFQKQAKKKYESERC